MFGNWEELEHSIENCKKCSLSKTVTKKVIGKGNKNADILFVGEAPGREEDMSGVAFVGQAGKLLDKLLLAVGLNENDYYIANILKCRPPNNRNPKAEEAKACIGFLRNQALLIDPKIIVTLGSIASKNILKDTNFKITRQRGIVIRKNNYIYLPTYHPAALLRDVNKKVPMYKDLKKVKEIYEELKKDTNR